MDRVHNVYGRNLDLAQTLTWIKHGRTTDTWTRTRWYVTEEGMKAYKTVLKCTGKNKIGKCPEQEKITDIDEEEFEYQLSKLQRYDLLVRGWDNSKGKMGYMMTHDLEQLLEVMADVFRGKVKSKEYLWEDGTRQKFFGAVGKLFRL